jgi:hypothetical protein
MDNITKQLANDLIAKSKSKKGYYIIKSSGVFIDWSNAIGVLRSKLKEENQDLDYYLITELVDNVGFLTKKEALTISKIKKEWMVLNTFFDNNSLNCRVSALNLVNHVRKSLPELNNIDVFYLLQDWCKECEFSCNFITKRGGLRYVVLSK